MGPANISTHASPGFIQIAFVAGEYSRLTLPRCCALGAGTPQYHPRRPSRDPVKSCAEANVAHRITANAHAEI